MNYKFSSVLELRDYLFIISNEKLASFNQKLIPNISKEKILGINISSLRKIAKEIAKNKKFKYEFLDNFKYDFLEEAQIYIFLLNDEKDEKLAEKYLKKAFEFIDNWALTDAFKIDILYKNKDKIDDLISLLEHDNYICRYAIITLLKYYLKDNFHEKILIELSKIKSENYYVKMAISWFFEEAIFYQFDKSICYLENKIFEKEIHNMIIKKIIESNKFTIDTKNKIKLLKL